MRFLVDEMFSSTVAVVLREQYGQDAVHVSEVGLLGRPDERVAEVAMLRGRALVTENVVDFAGFPDLIVLVVWKYQLAPGGAQAYDLASVLSRWSQKHPAPTSGIHWPASALRSSPTTSPDEPYGGTGDTTSEVAGIYVHRSFDLGISVDATCVGEVLEALERA